MKTVSKKFLDRGDNHPARLKFVGCEVSTEQYEKVKSLARRQNRSVSGFLRQIIDDRFFLAEGDNHPGGDVKRNERRKS